MNRTKTWIAAARLRTLPLSVSGIIVGTAIAHSKGFFDITIFILALLTTIGFQVLSNFSNDYGDGVKGTDNLDRVGPARAIQSGLISPQLMKKGIVLTTVITLLFAILLIYKSFGIKHLNYTLIFFFLGIGAIVAAIKYTVGKSAYGYHGFGDLFVFIFFGLVSVLGSLFLYTKSLDFLAVLPAITVGFLSVAVLNLNNLRDMENDAKAGKRTLIVKLGRSMGVKYHFMLIIIAILSSIAYSYLTGAEKTIHFLYVLAFIPLIIHLIKVSKTKDLKALDPELKKIALSTFLFAILFSFS